MARCAQCGLESAAEARFCPGCGASLERIAPERRKLATILFCDVSGSTGLGERLDAESVREIMLRYFRAMREAIDRHGGTVEKFIGDAVVAVFGVPVAHEDDAVRAVRAAAEMRERVAELNDHLDAGFGVRLAIHMGLHSGEVVSGDASSGGTLVTGDAVNVAARLQQAAAPGDILLGESTYRLARHAVSAELVEPVAAKGKSQPVTAYRLLSVPPGGTASARPAKAPMVGRTEELETLDAAFAEAVRSRSCRLCVVVGEAGVGKSRLAAEFQRGVDGTVLYGQCLPYGEGITYWPLAEVVRQAAAIRDEHSVGAARARISTLLAGEPTGSRVASVLWQALGLAEGTASSADIAWAARKFLEALARERPLVVCLDELQWAEASFLDLIESTVARSRAAPILLLGLARPEFLRQRPGWQTLRLEPLPDVEATQLVAQLADLDEDTGSRVIARAEGNPLFVEELVAAIVEDPALELPPTLDALLSARLDRLQPTARAVIERGSIEGQTFHRGAIEALSDDLSGPGVGAALEALTAAELIHPSQSSFAGDVSYRFHHILVRDAAYRGIAKKVRAELHEQFADWLLQAVGERVAEHEEVLGYQLEQSYRLRAELGNVDPPTLVVASRAAGWLASAGRRAFARGDMAAAAGLLRRAARLLDADPPRRLELLPELGKACRFAGDRTGAEAVLREAVDQSVVLGDRRLMTLSRVEHTFMRLYTDPDVETEEALRVAEEALGVFTELADEGGLAQAWALIGHANWLLCRGTRMEEAFTRALECTQRAGDPREQGWILRMLALVYYHGPTPVADAIERCEEILRLGQGHAAIEVSTRAKIAGLEAMRGRFDVARDLYQQCRKVGEEFALGPVLAALPNYSGPIELLAGDLEAAERELRSGCEALERLGETSTLSTSAALLARTLELQGQLDEAERFTILSEQTASDDDLASQTTWRGVRARVLAQHGELEQAERLAREGARVAARTDFLVWRGEALLDLAEVLRLSGDPLGSSSSAEEALQLFEAKGHLVLRDRTRALFPGPVEVRPA
jgi:class 3 adenylate cyclase/tetratricopeptide (TPR) repeat protein